jgi:ribosomal protein S18 acetylase RimI-like enzyme
MTAPTYTLGWTPGLIGEIAAAHARYYSAVWGFGAFFEGKVAAGLSGFVARMEADDLLLSVRDGEDFAGSITVDLHDPEAQGLAHLRWFIVTGRGRGYGRALMERAVAHLDRHRRACYLDTFAGLDPARHLYEAHGFRLTRESVAESWGSEVTEQRFERPAMEQVQ